MLDKPSFPFGTLAVNVVGCFAMGLLGGFTTFSAFAYETTSLLRDSRLFGAWLNDEIFGTLRPLGASNSFMGVYCE